MDLRPTPEQDALREVVQDFIATANPPEKLNPNIDDARSVASALWTDLADLGWLGLTVPDELGGVGASHADAVVLLEELGAGMLPVPVLATVAHIIPWLVAAEDVDLLGAVMSGERRLAYAGAAPGARSGSDPQSVVESVDDGPAVRITGRRTWVVAAEAADAFIVPLEDDRSRIALVAATDATLRRVESIDASQPVAEVEFDGAPARILLDGHAAVDASARVRELSTLFAAAEGIGMMGRLLSITTEFVSMREQFDRPVATFQGVSHQLADLYVDTELGRSLVLWAAAETDAAGRPAATPISAAGALVLPAAVRAAETAIQLHGGIGMTWESPLHRYYKHALFLRAMHGGRGRQLRDVAEAVLAGAR